MVKVRAEIDDKISCIFFNNIKKVHSMKFAEEITCATSADIFKTDSYCFRMIHLDDVTKDHDLKITDFVSKDSRGTTMHEYRHYHAALNYCPKIDGVNYPIGIAFIDRGPKNLPLIGTITNWQDQTLENFIDSDDFNPVIGVQMLVKISKILDDIHDLGFVHTDIKPANILVNKSGDPVISDVDAFLKIGVSGLSRGTAGYMSPEMAGSLTMGPEVDSWSIAAMIFDVLLTNDHAFEFLGYEDLFDYDKICDSDYSVSVIIGQTHEAIKKLQRSIKKSKILIGPKYKNLVIYPMICSVIIKILEERPRSVTKILNRLAVKIEALM